MLIVVRGLNLTVRLVPRGDDVGSGWPWPWPWPYCGSSVDVSRFEAMIFLNICYMLYDTWI